MRRPCLTCGALGEWGRSGRCPEHRRATERRRSRLPHRRAVKAERYDTAHRALRARFAPHVDAGRILCARCHDRINPGEPWDLDHLDDGRRWPSHANTCNRSARRNPDKATA